ncbi:hypothetical protein [Sphingobium sp. SCG-1]|uniref:hypothetical protein n=1 Tax=Sphingobium sp. SCG-1 TaxID=2072936 RepID=UPI001670517F|nr:hypothetical protein [Sphingobium sp. SCG-1]
MRSATGWHVDSTIVLTLRALSPDRAQSSKRYRRSPGRGEAWIGFVLLGRVLQELRRELFLPRRVPGWQDGALQGADGALKLHRLLVVDLNPKRRADLPHARERRLLGRDNGIDLSDAEVGEQVRLVDRSLGVPDIGEFRARVSESRQKGRPPRSSRATGRRLVDGRLEGSSPAPPAL